MGALVVVIYVLGFDHRLAGDEVGYDGDARLFAEGRKFWSAEPFAVPHPSAWKAPGYSTFLGVGYSVFGASPKRIELIQALTLAPLTVLLCWLLAARLFGTRVAIIASYLTALFPLSWEFFGLLFPEALAIPLLLLALNLMIDRTPTPRLASLVGVVLGLNLLVRPSSAFLFATAAAAWIVAAGLRGGLRATAIAVVAAVLVVAPWTIRNAATLDGFLPISMQDAAGYGTFNDEAAAEDWVWRPILDDPPSILERPDLAAIPEPELHAELLADTRSYIREHPLSLPKAMWWNGVRRFWELRNPADAIAEADFQGRSRGVRGVGLGLYYPILALALAGLWMTRRRAAIVWPIAATVVAVAFCFAAIGATRYRAPLEPGLMILAALAISAIAGRIPIAATAGAGPRRIGLPRRG